MRFLRFVLIFLIVVGCEKVEDIRIEWENNKAVSVWIKKSLIGSLPLFVAVRVSGNDTDVLGKFEFHNETILFLPDVPLERGQTYDIYSGRTKVHSFTVAADPAATPPFVISSFPSCDTVPENLLKMYLVFDQPMREGKAYDYIHFIDRATNDTVKGAFLDLQPELWNEDQTILTLWLDPGRIKSDLIPNKTLGAVLKANSRYRLIVSHEWKSKSGLPMKSDYQREHVTRQRDSRKPDIKEWRVTAGDKIEVEVGENLDWSLLNSVISIWLGDDQIDGTVEVQDCEKSFRFVPEKPLAPGVYRMDVEFRLEDLAGNSLNRLFETDVTAGNPASENKSIHSVEFTVR